MVHLMERAKMNLLEKRIERLAYELFESQGYPADQIPFKIKELQLCYLNGYNSRSEILGLIKKVAA